MKAAQNNVLEDRAHFKEENERRREQERQDEGEEEEEDEDEERESLDENPIEEDCNDLELEDQQDLEDNENEVKKTRFAQLQNLKENTKLSVENQQKQLDDLMKQSEIFSHFLSEGDELIQVNSSSNGGGKEKKVSTAKSRARLSEEVEDKYLMKISQAKGRVVRLMGQPASITGGAMRSYQIEGLNWMIRLHENGINGILADEMGLGMLPSSPWPPS
jgi:SWI/SNF-related matrix-associated actin-dependent regulator of chromatin subfamily A member 5